MTWADKLFWFCAGMGFYAAAGTLDRIITRTAWWLRLRTRWSK